MNSQESEKAYVFVGFVAAVSFAESPTITLCAESQLMYEAVDGFPYSLRITSARSVRDKNKTRYMHANIIQRTILEDGDRAGRCTLE
jgi:hypothetical protein